MMRHRNQPLRYPGDWVEQAACADEDPSKFYPPDDKPVPRNFYAIAKAICRQCSVVDKCLNYGKDEPYGVWGMTTPVERDRMRERRNERERNHSKIENTLPTEPVTGRFPMHIAIINIKETRDGEQAV